MTAYPSARLLAAVVAIGVMTSCDVGPRPPVTTKRLVYQSTSYTDRDKQQRLQEALRQAGVPHETYIGDDNREYVKWNGDDSAAVERIQVSLFGEPLPAGRSIHFSAPYNDRFKKWLTDSGIPFTTRLSDGKEYVIWQAADYPRVAKWEHFPRETYGKAHQLSSNPTVDTDARKSGARGSP